MPSMDVAGRLGRALTAAGLSQSKFQEAMKGYRHLRGEGISKPSVNAYLHGRNVPRLPFIEAAAEVLGVRAAWLAFDEGEMTPEAEAEVRGRGGVRLDLPQTREVQRVIATTFPASGRLHPVHQSAIRNVASVLARSRAAADGEPDAQRGIVWGPEDLELNEPGRNPDILPERIEAARDVAAALEASMEAIGVDPDELGDGALFGFVWTSCAAFLHLMDQDQLGMYVIGRETVRETHGPDQGDAE